MTFYQSAGCSLVYFGGGKKMIAPLSVAISASKLIRSMKSERMSEIFKFPTVQVGGAPGGWRRGGGLLSLKFSGWWSLLTLSSTCVLRANLSRSGVKSDDLYA